MKAQISRISFKETKDYSAVYQQQGRMLTDADWNEMVRILKNRMDRTVGGAIASGSPREEGILDSADSNFEEFEKKPLFHWGRVYVDGLYGELRGKPGASPNPTITNLLQEQRDFPNNPSHKLKKDSEYLVFIDLWERLVVAREDEEITDVALHGADTCVRSQTMVQVKLAKTKTETGRDTGFKLADLLPHGTAQLSVAVPKPTRPSDPRHCYDEGQGETTLSQTNTLVRVEAHKVIMAGDQPEQVELKWSAENGAEERKYGDWLDDFLDDEHVYECFSTESEKHLGEHPLEGVDGWRRDVGKLHTRTTLPKNPVDKKDRIRRWDGAVTLKRTSAGQWVLKEEIPERTPKVAAVFGNLPDRQDLVLTLAAGSRDLVLTLSLSAAGGAPERFMAGDYWLVLLRDRGNDLTAETLSPEAVGIDHHYLAIGAIKTDAAGDIDEYELDKPTWRRLSFPSLTNLTLDRVLVKDDSDTEQALSDLFVEVSGDTMTGPLKFDDGSGNTVMTLSATCKRRDAATPHTSGGGRPSTPPPDSGAGGGRPGTVVPDSGAGGGRPGAVIPDSGLGTGRPGNTPTLANGEEGPCILFDPPGSGPEAAWIGASTKRVQGNKNQTTLELGVSDDSLDRILLNTSGSIELDAASTIDLNATKNVVLQENGKGVCIGTNRALANRKLDIVGNTCVTGALDLAGSRTIEKQISLVGGTTPSIRLDRQNTDSSKNDAWLLLREATTYGASGPHEVNELELGTTSSYDDLSGNDTVTFEFVSRLRQGVTTELESTLTGGKETGDGNVRVAPDYVRLQARRAESSSRWTERKVELHHSRVDIAYQRETHIPSQTGTSRIRLEKNDLTLSLTNPQNPPNSTIESSVKLDGEGIHLVTTEETNVTGPMFVDGALVQTSDKRSKKKIQSLKAALGTVQKLRGVTFESKDKSGPSSRRIGFVAQEVQKVLPEMVVQRADGVLGICYSELIPLLSEALKESNGQIAELQRRIETLESKHKELADNLSRLLKS